MDKKQIQKNKFDLEYREHLQKLGAIYSGLTLGTLSFIGVFIFRPEYFLIGLIIIVVFWIVLWNWHSSTKRDMSKIMDGIKKLRD